MLIAPDVGGRTVHVTRRLAATEPC